MKYYTVIAAAMAATLVVAIIATSTVSPTSATVKFRVREVQTTILCSDSDSITK
jgi:hypothetical protein